MGRVLLILLGGAALVVAGLVAGGVLTGGGDTGAGYRIVRNLDDFFNLGIAALAIIAETI